MGAKRVVILNVSGAFHSDLMLSAKEKLAEVLDQVKIIEPGIDFISNVDGKVTKDPERIRTNLADQLDNKTLWEASVNTAISMGITHFLELGPGKVLKGLMRKIDKNVTVISLNTLEDITELIDKKTGRADTD